jgi:galactokinase
VSIAHVARWRAPGRVNLIGEHTDYNDGFALPFAIQSGVSATVTRRHDGMVHLSSAQEAVQVQIATHGLVPGSVTGWAAYPAGVVWAVDQRLAGTNGQSQGQGQGQGQEAIGLRPTALQDGVDIAIDGDVPLGAGLSSSAAVVCSTVAALNEVLGLDLPAVELVRLSRQAENLFVGAPTGGMDQTASMLCEAGCALFIDARTMATRQVPFDVTDHGLAILVTDSRVRHAHAEGGYASRRAACVRAAEVLGVQALRDISMDGLEAAIETLADADDDADLQRVTRHVVTENARVLRAVDLLDRGQLDAVGPLLNASHDSIRDDFRASAPEVDAAVDAARAAGALGSRITGGGFGGCSITLAAAGDLDRIKHAITDAYAAHSFSAPRFWSVIPSRGAHSLA